MNDEPLTYEEAWEILRKSLAEAGFTGDEDLEKILAVVDKFLEKHLFDLE